MTPPKASTRWRRSLALTGLIIGLPLAWAPLDRLSKDHALLLNASKSLPNWAFWLDKHAPITRDSLVFFEPPPSDLVTRHFGAGPQIFGKRVLGMPGDLVSHRGMTVLINGQPVAIRHGKMSTRRILRWWVGLSGWDDQSDHPPLAGGRVRANGQTSIRAWAFCQPPSADAKARGAGFDAPGRLAFKAERPAPLPNRDR